MAYMTLPPVVEVREAYKREKSSASVLAAWFRSTGATAGSWKSELFAKIDRLERGPDVPGLGNFKLSEDAAGQIRLQIASISLQSLPFPSVIAISGQGAQLGWRTGNRSVEMTVFADGELVLEAAEHGNPVDLDEAEGIDSYLEWLVGVTDLQLVYGAAR